MNHRRRVSILMLKPSQLRDWLRNHTTLLVFWYIVQGLDYSKWILYAPNWRLTTNMNVSRLHPF